MIIKKLPLLICKKFSILFQESTVFNLEECEQSELFFEGIKCFFTITAENTILVVDSVSVEAGDTVYKGETLVTFENGTVIMVLYYGEITEVNVENGDGASSGTILFRIEDAGEIILPITREDNNVSDGMSGGSSLTADTVSVKEGDVVKKRCNTYNLYRWKYIAGTSLWDNYNSFYLKW